MLPIFLTQHKLKKVEYYQVFFSALWNTSHSLKSRLPFFQQNIILYLIIRRYDWDMFLTESMTYPQMNCTVRRESGDRQRESFIMRKTEIICVACCLFIETVDQLLQSVDLSNPLIVLFIQTCRYTHFSTHIQLSLVHLPYGSRYWECYFGSMFYDMLSVPFLGISELGGHLGCHQLKGRQWAQVLTQHFSRIVIKSYTVTLKYDCRPHWIPNIIGLEYCQSDDACMPLDQSAVNCCLIVACLYLERSSMPLGQWALSVLWQGNAFFCHAIKLSSKVNLKYWYSK